MAHAETALSGEQNYYIVAAEAPSQPAHVLKHDDVFGVFDPFGDIDTGQRKEAGIYFKDVRFLSRSVLRFGGSRLMLLSSTVRRDNVILAVDLTNPDLHGAQGLLVPRGSLHVYRSQFLGEDSLYQRLRIRNYSRMPIEVRLILEYAADFTDIFQIRGTDRLKTGNLHAARIIDGCALIEYDGLDCVVRRTTVHSPSIPGGLRPYQFHFNETLPPQADRSVELSFTFETGDSTRRPTDYESALARTTATFGEPKDECTIWTSNEQFNAWLDRSRSDLRMLITRTEDGIFPYAGIPWFATPFGRDGVITALEYLWINPELARGVLRYLTDTQATTLSPEQDAEPGKILHEARNGEMAALGEIPFGRYYGSVDSTPLYLLLAGAYYKRTCDRDFLEDIWGGIERALQWTDQWGDPDHDGFVEYKRKSDRGLVQQGWKDSEDSIFYQDGRLVEGPVALCEVQAYVYAAKSGLAEVAAHLNRPAMARDLAKGAQRLRQRFEKAFWSPSIGTYAIALDGKKRRCEVRSSNSGQVLFCGLSGTERARAIAKELLSEKFYSGWGIRTVAEGEARYNPMSYHNGSIWPHDNALIAAGFSRYGFTDLSARVLQGLFQAAASLDMNRLPELFCGFRRRAGKAPTWYPTACSPQAWSAAAVFLLLQSSIGLSIDTMSKRITLRYPVLPDFLERVHIRDLRAGDAVVDLRLFRTDGSVAVTVERRVGQVEVVVLR
jgi:glycogen debranching enzyme